jgi:MFS transporter, DHA1 family, multidrug resistance protein
MQLNRVSQVSLIAFINKFSPHIFIVILPVIADALNSTVKTAQITITIFFVGSFLGLLFVSPLADTYGSVRIMKLFIPVFIVGSVVAAAIHSLMTLYLGVFTMGLAITSVNATAKSILHVGEKKVKRIASLLAFAALISYLAPSIAMITGSYAALHFGWPAVFIINASFGVLIFFYLFFTDTPLQAENKHGLVVGILDSLNACFNIGKRLDFLPLAIANAILHASLFFFVTAGFYTLHFSLHVSLTDIGLGMIIISIGAILGSVFVLCLNPFFAHQRLALMAVVVSFVSAAFLVVFTTLFPGYWSFFVPYGFFMIGAASMSSLTKAIFMMRFPQRKNAVVSVTILLQVLFYMLASFAGAHVHYDSAFVMSSIILVSTAIAVILIIFDSLIVARGFVS